jgi:hypothetical protein
MGNKDVAKRIKNLAILLGFSVFLLPSASASEDKYEVVMPTEKVKTHCVISGCDSQVFYRYFYDKKNNFCSAKKNIEKNRRQSAMRKYMTNAAREAKMPASVGLIPMLESSYSLGDKGASYSKGAAGPWQFLPPTARDMGLEVSQSKDERYDLQKSTVAGLRYIKWLSNRFDGNHNLAVLSYHAGIGRVEKLIKAYGTNNAWFIAQLISENHPDKNYLNKYHSYGLVLSNNGCGEL